MSNSNRESVKRLIERLKLSNQSHAESHEGFDDVQEGQKPELIYVGCSDSRVSSPFGNGFNVIFEVKNAGNRIDLPELSASATYSAKHIPEAKILYILGHTKCGAIMGSQGDFSKENYDLKDYLGSLSGNLKRYKEMFRYAKIPEGMDESLFISTLLAEVNVDLQVKKAMEIYRDLVDEGKLVVMGGMYDIHGIYPNGQGIAHIINVEGITDLEELKENEFVKNLEPETIHRYTQYVIKVNKLK